MELRWGRTARREGEGEGKEENVKERRDSEARKRGERGREEGEEEEEITYILGDNGEDCLHEGKGGPDPTLPPASKYQRNHHWSGWTQNH